MDKRTKAIKIGARLLVDQILSESIIDANETLKKMILLEEERREHEVQKNLIEEASDFSASFGSPVKDNQVTEDDDDDVETGSEDEDFDDADTDADAEGDEGEGEGGEEEGFDTGTEIAGDDDEENMMGEGPANEMANEFANLNHRLNKAKINVLYNKISTLKSQLNSMNLDTDDMNYVELDTKLSFYAEALENLQQKSIPGIAGTEQSEVEDKIAIIDKALKTLASEISGSEDDIDTSDEAGSEDEGDEGDEDAGAEGEDEAEDEGEGEGEEGEEEEAEDEEEAEEE